MTKLGVTILKYNSSNINLKDYKISDHIREHRKERINALKIIQKEHNVNPQKAVDFFYVKDDLRTSISGRNSDTIDVITEGGIIFKLSPFRDKKIITFLIARPEQLKIYYDAVGKEIPQKILKISIENQKRGLNRI